MKGKKVLVVRVMFEPNRLRRQVLADAYEQVTPVIQAEVGRSVWVEGNEGECSRAEASPIHHGVGGVGR